MGIVDPNQGIERTRRRKEVWVRKTCSNMMILPLYKSQFSLCKFNLERRVGAQDMVKHDNLIAS